MHSKKIINNSLVSIIYRIVIMLIGFITRKMFILFLSDTILGLNSFYANLLDLLNLADLGIGVAVQYQLYEPLVKKDYEKLSKIITATKKIYNVIGFFILIAGIILSFFIPFLIKDSIYSNLFIQSTFIISVLGTSLGYFFVHKRLLLQANEDIALVNIIDMCTKLCTVIISLISIVLFHNYIIYLIITALNGLISNLIVNYIFNLKYNSIKSNVNDFDNEMKGLLSNLKQVVPMKLSNYIYNSTDNIIITKFIGLETVAKYTNYMTIINSVMAIEYLIGNVVTSSIGKLIKELKDNSKIFEYFELFEYFQYLFTSFCTTALYFLITPLISLWIGTEFILDSWSLVLLVIDFFIHSMYQPAYVLYGSVGMFKKDKVVTLISAIMNIVISLILVIFTNLPGVIIGTLITDIYIWIARSFQVVKQYFKEDYKKYLIKIFKHIVYFIISFVISYYLCTSIQIDNKFLELIFKGIIILIINFFILLFCTRKEKGFIATKKYVLKFLRKDT